jgi:double-stranded uracil-DNA glycosylase
VSRARGFPPIAAPDARLLILGSMPGRASLAASEYYAQPRNAFWPIAAELFGVDPAAPYPRRCEALCAAGVALWDVLASCERPGSLDSAIRPTSARANAFGPFFRQHPGIRAVWFNGRAAEAWYLRLVLPGLARPAAELPLGVLPSTSPAHAALNLRQKQAHWARVLETPA